MRKVVLYQDETAHWVAECPSLPGCISQGASLDEAIRNIKEAIEAYIEDLQKTGETAPDDHTQTTVVTV